jgi:hypothetical protein
MPTVNLLDYLAYGVLILNLVGAVWGICVGIYLAYLGEKYRGWESPWSLIARDTFSLLCVALIFLAFRESTLDGFWTAILAGFVGLPGIIYVFWNDHKYARLSGTESPFDNFRD